MKISVTEKFLRDLYETLEKFGDVFSFVGRVSVRRHWANMENPIFRKYRHDMGRRKFGKFIYQLKAKGYIEVDSLSKNKALMLTKDGLDKALKASFKLDRKKRTDGKWTMLIFDIPVGHKKSRNLLKSILVNLGYKLLQQSVWVCPYEISNKTEKYLQMYNLDRYVKLFLVEGVE